MLARDSKIVRKPTSWVMYRMVNSGKLSKEIDLQKTQLKGTSTGLGPASKRCDDHETPSLERQHAAVPHALHNQRHAQYAPFEFCILGFVAMSTRVAR